jgi:hypothetical protein
VVLENTGYLIVGKAMLDAQVGDCRLFKSMKGMKHHQRDQKATYPVFQRQQHQQGITGKRCY